MDIPDWSVWIALALTLLQALGLVSVIRRLGGPDPVVRSKARLDLLETVGSLLALASFLLGLKVAEPWFSLAFAGFALMTFAYAVKAVRLLRARHRPTA
ncbi:hypothetical protein ACFVZH_28280 [Streptomyces sp. NPDC059534]|uniref:hypothetical protein n=1 Tax=Streptomyces sp. NPDC059534 TaxID=3346859 RepID=UPI0036BEA28A